MPAHILKKNALFSNEWCQFLEKSVEWHQGGAPESFYSVLSSPYMAVVAITPQGKIPVVRQFRPAVESYVWELPAGLLEKGEAPEECCKRELWEEVGVRTQDVFSLGQFYPDTGRVANCLHAFFAKVSERDLTHPLEPGLEIEFLFKNDLDRLIKEGRFPHLTHVATLYLAKLNGYL